MARFQNCVIFKMADLSPNIWSLGDIFVQLSLQTKSKKTPFWLVLSLSPTPYIIHWSRWQLFCVKTCPKIETNCHFLLVTTWNGAQTTNPNRNIAGKRNLKSLPVAFFSQKFNIDFTVYAHKMARFQNCVMLFKMADRFSKYLGPRGHFGTSIMENKIQKDPVLARPEPISNTVYNTLE